MQHTPRPETMEHITTREQAEAFIEEKVQKLRRDIGDKKVLAAVIGLGSSVAAALLHKAIGKQLVCIFIDHGFMFKNEPQNFVDFFKYELGANTLYIDAAERFLNLIEGRSDGEIKRRIISEEYITIFNEVQEKEKAPFVAQETIYPKILEEFSQKSIKARRCCRQNINFNFEIIEPLMHLYGDEVRVVGRALGIPDFILDRRPFPAPGLSVRCLGAVTKERLYALREADAILCEEFQKCGLANKVWQYFVVIPDIKSVGVKDGSRYEGWPAILRALNPTEVYANGYTNKAEAEDIPYEILHKITERITSEVEGINRVLYDITPKPTGTIEWE